MRYFSKITSTEFSINDLRDLYLQSKIYDISTYHDLEEFIKEDFVTFSDEEAKEFLEEATSSNEYYIQVKRDEIKGDILERVCSQKGVFILNYSDDRTILMKFAFTRDLEKFIALADMTRNYLTIGGEEIITFDSKKLIHKKYKTLDDFLSESVKCDIESFIDKIDRAQYELKYNINEYLKERKKNEFRKHNA